MSDEDELLALTDEARARDAARARSRERWLRRQAEEDATFAASLVDLLEDGRPVVVRTAAGVAHRGVLLQVGSDFCALGLPGGERLYLALAAVVTVRPDVGARRPPAAGEEHRIPELTLLDVVRDEAAVRSPVRLAAAGGAVVTGRLRAVGADVVTVALESGAGPVLVQASSVWEVLVRSSG